ncbi:MAG: flippase-like domain-containing protein [Rhodothermaceae bacterium]|nr:flippase-like domain-containing protein [Rhodothermaceae bacterium]
MPSVDEQQADEAKTPLAERKVSVSNILWPLLLSVSVLVVIGYYTFDLQAFRGLLGSLNPWLLLAALGTVGTRVAFGGLRLHYFSHGRLSVRDGLRSQLAWDFFAYVTPSTIGGGPFAAVFVSKDRGLPLGEATSIFLFSMLMDQLWAAFLMPTMVILSFYVGVFPEAMGTIGFATMLTAFVVFVAWVAILAYGTLINPRMLAVLVGTVFRIRWLRRFRTRALRVMAEMRHRSTILRSQPLGFYAKGFLLTLIPWLSRYALPVFLIWSVYPSVDKLLVFLRAAALQLGALFLPTPGGAGAMEGLYLLFFGPPIMPEALVAPTLLAWRLLSYYLFIFAGTFIALQFIQRRVRSESADA